MGMHWKEKTGATKNTMEWYPALFFFLNGMTLNMFSFYLVPSVSIESANLMKIT